MELPTLYSLAATNSVRYWLVKVVREGEAVFIIREYGTRGGKAIVNRKQISEAKSKETAYDQAVFEAQKDWKDKKNKKGYVEDLASLTGTSAQLSCPVPGPGLCEAPGQAEEKPSAEARTSPVRKATPKAAAAAAQPAPARPAAASQPTLFKFLPMLANKFAERKKYVTYSCIVQPKLDGVRYTARMLPDGTIVLRSRSDSECPFFMEIKAALARLDWSVAVLLDGEFYSKRIPFRTLNGHCNRKKMDGPHGFGAIPPEDLASIHYHIFDCYFPDAPDCPFEARYAQLAKMMAGNTSPFLELVPNFPVDREEGIKAMHDQFVAEGYEGVMVRNRAGRYKLKDRSNDLLKLKSFQDTEFTIVGAEAPTNGKEEGCIIWELQVPGTEETFTCRPRDTYEARKADWLAFQADPKQFVGQQYTVRYQETYDNGVPRFPSGVAIRYDAV